MPATLRRRRWLAGLALTLLLPTTFVAAAVEVPQMRLERSDDGLYLSAALAFDLPPLVEDALYKGIPLFFVAEARVLRERWYWTDQRIAVVQRHMRLAYQPLTRRWRLNVSPQPFGTAGLGVSLSQNFEELNEALDAIRRISRWRIADIALLDPEQRYTVGFDFRLDTSQLPRPLQMGIAGRSDWSLSADRTLQLPPESGR